MDNIKIKAVLNELVKQINEDDASEQKTLMDFFKPSMDQFIYTIANCILEKMKNNPSRFTNLIDIKMENGVYLMNIEKVAESISDYIQTLDGNFIMNNIKDGKTEPFYMKEVRALVISGNKLQAVKYLKEISGLGLKEAKDVVDNMKI